MRSGRSGIGRAGSGALAKAATVVVLCLSVTSLSACGGDSSDKGASGAQDSPTSAPPSSMPMLPVSSVQDGVKDGVAKLKVKQDKAADVEALLKLACVVKQTDGKGDAAAGQIKSEAKDRKLPEAEAHPEIVIAVAHQHLCP
ncbi:hypothetical protein KEM60_00123 [Austwickia sp. TVS 96-490-7B]|uniref:hypothetical protein n=1 Tax=Austwickia sp. TVS 96-490-7B TaxID=2830843 RepID=UPI001C593DFA|nr:hypothetical protein [Austwickia sp. TVS 96-490-7B]MBW3083941.1 hypothetical protein [Austwickia sp. TVS 96-490-7B]